MDIMFENDHERTPETIKEIYRHCCFKRPVHIVIYAVLGAVALWNIVAAFWFWEFIFDPLVCGVFFLLIQFIIYKRNVRIIIDRDREQHGSASVKVQMEVTEEGIRGVYGENKANPIPLSSIKRVYKTKNLIVLLTKARLMLIFDRRKFTVGTQEEFLEYLRSNGLKA